MNSALMILEPEDRIPAGANTPDRPGVFDYDGLATDVARSVQQSADHIRGLERDAVQALFAIGRELIKSKDALPHGRFGPWLEAEFGWSERSAQRYMRAAKAFGNISDTVSVLGPTAIHALAARSTAQEVRDDIVAQLHSGEGITTQAVLERVKAARSEARAKATQAVPMPQSAEQMPDQVPAEAGRPDDNQHAGEPTAARRAAELLLKQLDHGWDELAVLFEAVDPVEFLKHLQRGCAAEVRADVSVQPKSCPASNTASVRFLPEAVSPACATLERSRFPHFEAINRKSYNSAPLVDADEGGAQASVSDPAELGDREA